MGHVNPRRRDGTGRPGRAPLPDPPTHRHVRHGRNARPAVRMPRRARAVPRRPSWRADGNETSISLGVPAERERMPVRIPEAGTTAPYASWRRFTNNDLSEGRMR